MAASVTKSGGVYIEINGNPQPLYEVLRGVKDKSSEMAKQIAGDFQNAVAARDISKNVNAVSNAFAQLRVGVRAAQADFSAYDKRFQSLAGRLGLAGEQAKAFSASLSSALKRQNEGNVTAALRAIQRQTGMTTAEVNRLAKSFGVADAQLLKMQRDAAGMSGLNVGNLLKGAGVGALAFNMASPLVDAVRQLTDVRELLNSMMRMDTLKVSYGSIFGGAEAGVAQLDHIYEVTQKLGLNFQSAAEGAKGFFAASKGTSLEADANLIFESVSTAAQALHLSQEDVQGVFLALSQMVSKGKVSMEELRRQLGDRLPGAFQLAAKAMGMTTAELDKAVSSGQVMAEDLLPKLADVLRNQYAAAAEEASKSVQSSVNRMTTEWERFKASILDSDAVIGTLNLITGALKARNDMQDALKRRERAAASLRARGVKGDMGDFSAAMVGSEYSREMLDAEGERLEAIDKAWAAHEASASERASRMEKDAEEARKRAAAAAKAIDDAYNKTDAGRLEALKKQRESLQDSLRTLGIDASADQIRQTQTAIASLDKQIAEFGKKKGGGAGLANKQFRFDTGLEQLRQEVANMEATLDPAAQGVERMRQKLELERQNAIAAAEAHAKLSVQRKEATPAEAEERKGLEIRKAEITYTQKLAEVEAKNRDVRVKFYQDLAQLSGNYTESIRLQTEALREQAREFEGAGIASDVVRQWEELKKLQTARDPFSGMVRGLQKYSAEATDLASQVENAVTTSFSGMEDAFVQFVTTGKLSFTDLANSIIADLARIAVKAAITGPLAQGIGGLFSGLFNSFSYSPAQTATMNANGMYSSGFGLTGVHGHALGGAYIGGSISDYANSIVDTPTYFNLGSRITAFARGAGVMGEAGAEAIMPLRRGANGRLGVEMYGDSNREPQAGGNVQVNIINSTGEQVSQQTRTDNYGNKTIDVMIGDAAAAQAQKPGSRLNKVMRGVTGTQQQVVRR